MSRVLVRPPKSLARLPYRARRAPQHDDVVAAVVEVKPVPRVLLVLPAVIGALAIAELVVAVVVTL
ncbi:MAG: hypothetical protein BGO45_04715 [Microbacterium sp. 71-36]|uniref:hypothetical protein n=1 Tax=unclassified Microbacterium TaxID=2609290 RepID=UPI000926161C|nr:MULTISPECIES: hypothetical protein [unclassified Microbacterium]MBN9210528.1 hypothetical protein [Microbacterium sp.]OJV75802.1 MAG: hypothetical protein BGO45_04715 [Microbacterium sp. 71-36]